jgi:alpha-galactosidase
METVGPKSTACSLDKYLLKRDGIVIKSDGRRFWDFRAPYTFDYLTEKVIELLGSCGFGYVKIDYNDTIGIGVDGAESLGEGLREHIEGVYRFFNKISESLPDIVIENCSSGGHRLEPSMMALASMASFSDAHETLEIPIIAANLHRLILPQQSQIWAVLRKNHDERRLSYLLTAAFLGRMCLSGDVCELTDKQWKHVLKAQDFYRNVCHIIKDGLSFRYGTHQASYRYAKGWQGIRMTLPDLSETLCIIHSFAHPVPDQVDIELPDDIWEIVGVYTGADVGTAVEGKKLTCTIDGEYSSCVVHLRRI